MNKAQSPYSVNGLAVLAARAAIQDREYVSRYVAQAIAARSLITTGLAALGIHAYPSRANFVLFRAGTRTAGLRDGLRSRGILVRDRSADIDGCLRVTCGTPEQAGRFLSALKEFW
jgi:histidinol-phosphate aminotransferase